MDNCGEVRVRRGSIVLRPIDIQNKEFEKKLKGYNCEIEIIDNTEKSEQQELVEDLVQIITVFSCKLQGKRANIAKKLIRELIQEETDGKSHKSNVDTKQCTEN